MIKGIILCVLAEQLKKYCFPKLYTIFKKKRMQALVFEKVFSNK